MRGLNMESPTKSAGLKEILKDSDLFHGLRDDHLDQLLPLCREELYEAGVVICPEGAPCHTIYVVESGRVALEMGLQISRAAEESATIAVVTRGGTLCCSGLINPYILTSTGRSLERTKVIALDTEELRELAKTSPEARARVMNNVAKIIASRLAHTRETMGHILAVIFHDLKAPLAAAESYNRLLLDGFVGELSEEQKNIVRRSSKRLSDLLNLISNMIDFSRVDFGALRAERVSLAEVIEDCAEAMRPLAEEKKLQFVVEIPQGLPAVLGIAGQLKQVITNLLSNAIKFTPSGGVTVRVKDEEDHVRVDVIDTGIGIPTEDLPKLFDGFYKGLDMEQRGAGLGLSISKKIIESQGGRIWALSPYPETGKGSQFIFTLRKDVSRPAEQANG
jgi:signal transduction histidine kinase